MTNGPKTELHPLEPFLPEGARLLMLGSFPPKRERWSMDFYYPNFQNDMWRIFGLAFFGDKDHFLDADRRRFDERALRDFLARKGVALCDTARSIVRRKDNASDKFLEVTETVDLASLLNRVPACRAVAVTGQKAADTLLTLVEAEPPRLGEWSPFRFGGREMRFYRMPSSSRAYPKPLGEKAAAYGRMFAELDML